MKNYRITVNGVAYDVTVEEATEVKSAPVEAPKTAPVQAPVSVPAGAKTVKAPMPGNILKVLVKPGDSVKKGQVLFILEAMKMENEIMAAFDGVIGTVAVSVGQSVQTDAVLASFQ